MECILYYASLLSGAKNPLKGGSGSDHSFAVGQTAPVLVVLGMMVSRVPGSSDSIIPKSFDGHNVDMERITLILHQRHGWEPWTASTAANRITRSRSSPIRVWLNPIRSGSSES